MSLLAAPALTWIAGVLDCWIAGLVRSDAVRVWVPAVFSVPLKVCTPASPALNL